LSDSKTNEQILVARPKKIGKTPVAIGSKVPVCPALFIPYILRNAATALKEAKPLGLSSKIKPFI
jgi:hypothetical protein